MPARAQIATEEYQLPHNAATDIPNHSRRRNGSSESLTEREALRSGWSAVRNRSSFLVGARVFESCFGGEPIMDSALEFRIDRDASRTILVQPACDGEPFEDTPADEFLAEMLLTEFSRLDGIRFWMVPFGDLRFADAARAVSQAAGQQA